MIKYDFVHKRAAEFPGMFGSFFLGANSKDYGFLGYQNGLPRIFAPFSELMQRIK